MSAVLEQNRRSFGDMIEELSERGVLLKAIERAVFEKKNPVPDFRVSDAVACPMPAEVPQLATPRSVDDFPGPRYAESRDSDNRSWNVLGNDPDRIFSLARLWPRRRKVSGGEENSFLQERRAVPFGKSHFDELWWEYMHRGDESVLMRFQRELGLTQLDFYGCRYTKGYVFGREYILSMVYRRTWGWGARRWVRVCVPLSVKRTQAPLVA